MTCERCGKAITENDVRERYERGDRDQPAYTESACRFCSPSSDDLDAAREGRLEQLIEERRERGWA